LDGQQRLTALLVGLKGVYNGKQTKKGKGARTNAQKTLFLNLLHDGRARNNNDETFYEFDFYYYNPQISKNGGYWFEVRRILQKDKDIELSDFISQEKRTISSLRGLNSEESKIVEHNLTRLYTSIWIDESVSFHSETDPSHERILEIFIRANSGGTKLSKSDLLLSTLTLHWGDENAREIINDFVSELNNNLTRKNKLNKDFVMKSCLVLLDLPVAYCVSSFTKRTCTIIKSNWNDVQNALKRAVDAANAFGIDEKNLTSVNALIPVAYYLYMKPKLTLRGESETEVKNASRVRKWLISALLNHVLGGSSDSMLNKLREVIKIKCGSNYDFPIADLNKAVQDAGRISASTDDAIENVINYTYGKDTCFLALSLLYDDRNWGTMEYSIDHLFPKDLLKRKAPDNYKEFVDDFCNLALVLRNENSGKKNRPLHEWLETRSQEYLKRHYIPSDKALWHIDQFQNFIIERRKLLRKRLESIFLIED